MNHRHSWTILAVRGAENKLLSHFICICRSVIRKSRNVRGSMSFHVENIVYLLLSIHFSQLKSEVVQL